MSLLLYMLVRHVLCVHLRCTRSLDRQGRRVAHLKKHTRTHSHVTCGPSLGLLCHCVHFSCKSNRVRKGRHNTGRSSSSGTSKDALQSVVTTSVAHLRKTLPRVEANRDLMAPAPKMAPGQYDTVSNAVESQTCTT